MKAKDRIKWLNHKISKGIFEILRTDGESSVGAIYKKLKIEQSVCSNVLSSMKDCNYIVARRDGRSIYYSINESEITKVQNLINQLEDVEA